MNKGGVISMAAIYVNELIKLFKKALNEKWGYIWGAAGETWTQAKQDAATREMTVKYGQKWVGKRVADCSGLFSWAFKELGGYMYHGSNTMWKKYCTVNGRLTNGKRSDGEELKPGTAVFQCRNGTDYYHVGLYIGDNTVIEAKGTASGVVVSQVSKWTHWGELKGISYDGSEEIASDVVESETTYTELGQRTLKYTSPNMKGDDVKKLQEKLNQLGYSCGIVDGCFGKKTRNALMVFQAANKLTVDGIFGAKSLAALNNGEKKSDTIQKDETNSEQTYTVVKGDTLGKIAKKLLGASNKYPEIMKANNLKNVTIHPGDVLIIPSKD